MAEYDRYINLPGFDNVNRALTLFNVPVDLYRQGDGSVDAIANPDNLPMRERIGRGIESLVGTAAYALTPLFARFGGQKAAQAIPEIFTGFSGSQAADEVVKDVVQDPSRRDFLKGAAATAGIATVAPSVITDVATQVAKRGPGAPRTSIFTSAAANIRELKRQIQDLQELKDDIDYRDNPNETPELTKELEEQYVQAGRDQDLNETLLKDEYEQVFEMLNDDPVLIKNAPDDDLEFVLENVYEDNVDIYDVVKNLNLENDMSDVIADEIKTRKLHLQKDKNGVDKYPYARLFLEDYQEINLGPISMPDPSMQMARETPSDLTEEMRQMRIRSADRIYKEKVEELREFTDFAEEKIQDIAERARQEELRRKAEGGPVEGIASLNDVARDMYRGPRGIGAYQQFSNGGGVNLNDFNFPPSREDRSQANFASYIGEPDKGPVIEGIESLANVEYEADMQNALSDNVSRLGFDPDIAFTILPGFDPKKIQRMGDHYSPGPDRMGIDPYKGSSVPEVQAHEYRHRGLEKVLKHFKKYPFLYKEKYGQESFDFLSKMLEQRRIDLVDRIKGRERSYPYSEFLHENFAEMFEQDYEAITGRYYQAEDGRVLVKGIHYGPGKEFETLDDWKEANPGVDLQLRITKSRNEDSRETPDVIKFRDYRVQRDRGELKEKIPKFEAVLQIQEAAGDLLKEIKEGKHKELFNKQQFSNGGAAMSPQVPQGISSLSETARLMYN